MTYALIYTVGFILTLIILARFGKRLGFANYDPPHPEYYDDWDSNAHAYVAFSAMWPVFVGFHVLFGFSGLLVKLTEKIICR